MNVAVIVAAGQGTRFGAEKPKQFLEIAGKPVIFHTLQRFEDCLSVNEIIVVVPENSAADFLALAASYELKKLKNVVAGGETRAESVLKGIKAIKSSAVEIVAIHDGARPLVMPGEITQTIEKAQEFGAAVLVAPVTDTIKKVSPDGKITGTIDRTTLRRALTPQCFQFELLRRAFAEIRDLSAPATDESFLVEQLGVAVSIVEGSARNIKITVPEDLVLAESLLKQFKA